MPLWFGPTWTCQRCNSVNAVLRKRCPICGRDCPLERESSSRSADVFPNSVRRRFELWVIYENPSDYPGCFVVREWLLDKPTQTFWRAATLEVARAIARRQGAATAITRHPTDDPVIVESWL